MPFDLNEAPDWLKTLASANEEKRRRTNEARRAKLAEERAANAAARAKELPAIHKAIEDAAAAEEAARRAHADARDRLARARADDYGASLAYSHRDTRIANELRDLADPRIAATIDQLIEQRALECRKEPVSWQDDTGRRTMGGKRIVNLVSERASLLARLDGMLRAMRELEQLQEQSVPDVDAAIAEILGKIPGVKLEVVASNMIMMDSGDWAQGPSA